MDWQAAVVCEGGGWECRCSAWDASVLQWELSPPTSLRVRAVAGNGKVLRSSVLHVMYMISVVQAVCGRDANVRDGWGSTD